MNKTVEYDLPDLKVLKGRPSKQLFAWRPRKTYVVLGRANKAEASLTEAALIDNSLIITKRPSGGESVILSPKMIGIAVLLPVIKGLKSRDYFLAVNDAIINELKRYGVKNLTTKGISDISIGEKKIMGSSVYRTRETVFYHAVLNVSEDIDLISKYLKHPTREPDYRKGRKHDDFVTSLLQAGYKIDIEELKASLNGARVLV